MEPGAESLTMGMGIGQQSATSSSLSTFVTASKCVRACNVPAEQGLGRESEWVDRHPGHGHGQWHSYDYDYELHVHVHVHVHAARHAETFEVNLK